MKRTTLVFLSLSVVCAFLPAQSKLSTTSAVYVQVQFVDGSDFSVIRSGTPVPFTDPVGLTLNEGDQVQTGKGTFVEMLVYPRKDRLKLSENTTFIIKKLQTSGEHSFQLLYGRVRAKVEKLAGAEKFTVAGANAVAGVRGTDFGYDVIATRQSKSATAEPQSLVYCFQGSVDVTTLTQPVTAKAGENLEPVPQNYSITAGEMLSVTKSGNKVDAIKSSVPEDIRSFWTQREFHEGSRVPTVAPAVATQAEPSPTLDLSEYAYVRETLARKNVTILTGAMIALAGAVLEGTGAYFYSGGDAGLGFNFVIVGSLTTLVSVPVMINGLSINPDLKEPGAK